VRVSRYFPLFSFNFFVSYYFVLILRTKADAPIDDGKSPFVTARAVTTRTATTHEDLGTNARTQQLEEKTVAHSMTSSATRQEQRTVTQEVKTTSTVVGADQVIIPFSFLYLFYFFLFFHLWLFNELISVAIKETITIHLFQYEDFFVLFLFFDLPSISGL
jgi:ABC-type Na+ efflux pump permease subunit